MSSSDTCSSRPAGACRAAARRAACSLLLILCLLPPRAAGAVQGEAVIEAALERVFAGADSVRRQSAFLTDEELERARGLAGSEVPIETALVVHYRAWSGGRVTGRAYLDAHRVRTHPETVLFALDGVGTITAVEVLRFEEPPDYRAPEAWSAQLLGRALDDGLRIGAGIRGITGATLTARAMTRAARRVLALDAVIRGRRGGTP